MHRLGERTKNDALFRKLFAKRRADRNGIKNRVHGHARELGVFAQRNAELLVSLQKFWIYVGKTFRRVGWWLRLGKISDVLKIYFRIFHELPRRFGHREPVTKRF